MTNIPAISSRPAIRGSNQDHSGIRIGSLLLESQETLMSPGYDSAHAYVTCVTFCQEPRCTSVATMRFGELLYDWKKFKS